MACYVSFPSCHDENDPNPKSGQYLDPDKSVCPISCRGDVNDPAFLRPFFVFFVPDSMIFAVGYWVSSSGIPP